MSFPLPVTHNVGRPKMFDPYHKWLGIQPKDQPPNHYRLLSLNLYESDLDVIEGAADRAMGFIRQYQAGEHASRAAQLLNEIANARLCLLKPSQKAEYDTKLRKHLEVPESATDNEMDFAFPRNSESAIAPSSFRNPGRKKPRSPHAPWIVGGVVAVVCVIVAVLVMPTGRNPRVKRHLDKAAVAKSALTPAQQEVTSEVTSKVEPARVEEAVEKPVEKPLEPRKSPLPSDGDVVLFINSNSGRCMTSNKDSRVVQGPTPDQAGPAERWKVTLVGEYFKLTNEESGKVLAVPASSRTSGVNLILWQDLNSEDQQWVIARSGDHFLMISRLSGLAVSVAYTSKDQNAGVIQWPSSNNPDQFWQIQRVSESNE